jgi:hypothetical protein
MPIVERLGQMWDQDWDPERTNRGGLSEEVER